MATLKDNQLYAIDGGLFRAVYDEHQERFELWTHAGQSGRVIARTGFDIDADDMLYHRVFDFENREQVRIPATGYTVADLEAVAEEEG